MTGRARRSGVAIMAARFGLQPREKSEADADTSGLLTLPPLYRGALVVFAGRAGVWWLRWLRPGFRHCFAAVDDGVQWLTVDPLLHRLEIRASGLPSGFDLAAEYRRMELVVLEIAPHPVTLRCAPFGIFSCVETVKRLLGFRARWVFTPWQLYRFLVRRAADRISGQASA